MAVVNTSLSDETKSLLAAWLEARLAFAEQLASCAEATTFETRETFAQAAHQEEKRRLEIAKQILARPDSTALASDIRQGFDMDVKSAAKIAERQGRPSAVDELIDRYCRAEEIVLGPMSAENKLCRLAETAGALQAIYTSPRVRERFTSTL